MQSLLRAQVDAVAANRSAPADVLLRLLHSGSSSWAVAVAHRRTLPPEVVDALVSHGEFFVRGAFLDNPFAEARDRARLAGDPHAGNRIALVEGPSRVGVDIERRPVAADVFERLAVDPDDRVRQQVAYSPDLTPAVAGVLARDPDPDIRRSLCWEPRRWSLLDRHARDLLLRDADDEVRREAALADAREEPERLRALLDSGAADIADVAVHGVLDEELSRRLADDERAWVRLHAAGNMSLALEAVLRLGEDPDPTIRLAVSVRPDLTEAQRVAIDYAAASADWGQGPVGWVARNHGSPEIMRRCAASGHVLLRRSAAMSPTLPPDVVRLLAEDSDDDVRRLLCFANPDAPVWLLERQALRPDNPYPEYVVQRPNYPRGGLARFHDDTDPRLRRLAVLDPDATPAFIEKMSHDPSPGVRASAAQDPRLPVARLLELLADPATAREAGMNPALPPSVMRRILDEAGVAPLP